MSKALHLALGPEAGLRKLLHALLESGRIKGVFVLSRVEGGRPAYAMLTDPARLEEACPFHPLMPVNLGDVLNRFTMDGPSSQPLAVVARPCELRAFVETVKRRQGHLENLFFISCTCGGVFPLGAAVQEGLEGKLTDYWERMRHDLVHPELRPTCRSCVEFVPYTADLTLRLVDGNGEFEVLANGPRGERLIDGAVGELIDSSLDQGRLSDLLEKRKSNREEAFQHDAGKLGLEGLVATFGRCIGCHACRNACPICYCDLCTFRSNTYEKVPEDYERELRGKQGVRLPPDTMFFHLGRMMHMAVSCVACGSCQDVCPVGIPVSIAFKKVGESLQRLFDYVPGKDPRQPVPVGTFELEEFMRIEDKEVKKE